MRSGMVLVVVFLACSGPRSSLAAGGIPNARLGTRTAPLLLLSRADVRTDLQLSPEQVAESERFIADLHDKALTLRGRNDPEAIAARAEIDQSSRRWIETHLGPDQRRRLDQVDLQWQGPSALLRPIVAETLGLTVDQRTALSRAIATRNSRRESGPPILADEAKLAETALSLLDDTQRERWHAMLGKPLPFQVAAEPPAASRTTTRR